MVIKGPNRFGLDSAQLQFREHALTQNHNFYAFTETLVCMHITLRLPEHKKNADSQNATQCQMYPRMVEGVRSCMPVFEFLKINRTTIKGDITKK